MKKDIILLEEKLGALECHPCFLYRKTPLASHNCLLVDVSCYSCCVMCVISIENDTCCI